MVYFICQEWNNTKGNHAGMVYLYKKIHKMDPQHTHVLVLPTKNNRFSFYVKWISVLFRLCLFTQKHDTVLFTECLSQKKSDQVNMARFLHVLRPSVRIWGMVHCIPSLLENLFPKKTYSHYLKPFNGVITLGSSLTRYLVENGVDKVRIHTLFHYVDNEYYKPIIKDQKIKHIKNDLSCICIGNLGRDYSLLSNIVAELPNIQFDICKGKKNIDYLFDGLPNVKLHGFMSENRLRDLMNNADISLNIMTDTIGSNAICSSLAMGLAMVCSDVGSIHDYCDDGNTIFCHNPQEFKKALIGLSENYNKVETMRQHSFELSQTYSILNYYRALNAVIN